MRFRINANHIAFAVNWIHIFVKSLFESNLWHERVILCEKVKTHHKSSHEKLGWFINYAHLEAMNISNGAATVAFPNEILTPSVKLYLTLQKVNRV